MGRSWSSASRLRIADNACEISFSRPLCHRDARQGGARFLARRTTILLSEPTLRLRLCFCHFRRGFRRPRRSTRLVTTSRVVLCPLCQNAGSWPLFQVLACFLDLRAGLILRQFIRALPAVASSGLDERGPCDPMGCSGSVSPAPSPVARNRLPSTLQPLVLARPGASRGL